MYGGSLHTILESISKLKIIKDFSCCYSPEINPGDKKRTLKNIKKLISSTIIMG